MTMLSDGMLLGVSSGFSGPIYIDSTQAWASGSSAFTPSTPTGIVAGDLLVAICNTPASARTWSATGWTSVASVNATHSIAILSRTATGTDSLTFNMAGGANSAFVFLFVYRSATTVSANNLAGATIASADPQVAASLSVTANRVLIAVLELSSGTTTLVSGPSGMTSRQQQFTSGNPRGAAYDLNITATGASGTKSFDISTATSGTAFLLEIQ